MSNQTETNRLKAIIAGMTLEEKAQLVFGADSWHTAELRRLGIPAIMMTDGPHGLRKEKAKNDSAGQLFPESEPATCFPTASALACSFDEDLLSEIGAALAKEARAAGVSVVLGPGINIKRSPLCGRNFEYFSEDPLLAGKLAAAYIKGMQGEGVGACLKHFALNNQDTARFVSSSNADQRTMRELYLRGFEIAVKESDPRSVMSSYNLVNGEYAGESKWLLTDLLRNEWGFDGAVISDWGAVCNRVNSIIAGLDLEMPGGRPERIPIVLDAIADGSLKEWQLDSAVLHILSLVSRCGKLQPVEDAAALLSQNHQLAARAAAECCVLLKNDGGLLPLKKSNQKIAVIGSMARFPRYQGSGSSRVNGYNVVSLLEELDSRGIEYSYAEGCLKNGSTNDELLNDARATAKSCDVAVLVIGLPDVYESEGLDRSALSLPDGILKLVNAVNSANPNTVVVLQVGAPVELPFCDSVKSILVSYLGGQGGGSGLADVLYGRHNPSGRLAESWPERLSDLPNADTCPSTKYNANYYEGIYCGYRYFDATNTKPMFPFGHGLSYSKFELGRPSLSAKTVAVSDSFEVTLSVANLSDIPGAETLLLYACHESGSMKKLAAFKKVPLLSGEKQSVKLTVRAEDFGYFNTDTNRFELLPGEYAISICGCCETVAAAITAKGGVEAPRYLTPKVGMPDREQWLEIYGRPLPERVVKPYNLNSTVNELRRTLIGKIIFNIVEKQLNEYKEGEGGAMITNSIPDLPMRAAVTMSGGMLSQKMASGIIDMANGHWFRGIKKVL